MIGFYRFCETSKHMPKSPLLSSTRNLPKSMAGNSNPQPVLSLPLRQKAKASSKKAKCATSPAGVSLAEPVREMIARGAPLTRTDRSGITVVDAAAACDAELLHYMLLGCNLKPTDALSHAIKHGDAPAAKVGQQGLDKRKERYAQECWVLYDGLSEMLASLCTCPFTYEI